MSRILSPSKLKLILIVNLTEWDTKIIAAKVSIKVGVDCTGQWCLSNTNQVPLLGCSKPINTNARLRGPSSQIFCQFSVI